MRKLLLLLLLLLLATTLLFGNGSQDTEGGSQESSEITIWYLGNELMMEGGAIDMYKKYYPNVTVNYVAIPNAEYVKKLTPVLRSGKNVPDIFVGEANYVKTWVDSPYWEDLSSYPGVEDTENLFEYVVDVGTDKKGVLKAIPHQATPGVIVYKRSIMQEVFGVSEPEDVAPYLNTIDAMLNTAEELKQKSNGKYRLFTGIDSAARLIFASRSQPWVNSNNELQLGNTASELLKLARYTKENGYEAGIREFSPAFAANLKKDGNVLVYVFSTWGVANVIRRQANDKDPAKNSMGDWGVIAPKTHYFWGGTWLGIYKDSKNKEAAWNFIRTLILNEDFVEELAQVRGDFPSNKNVATKLLGTYESPQLNGQNSFKVFNEEAKFINGKILTRYDFTIEREVLSVAKDYANISTMTEAEAIGEIKKRIKNAYPKITVE